MKEENGRASTARPAGDYRSSFTVTGAALTALMVPNNSSTFTPITTSDLSLV
jgi:hypothetical protein